MKTQLNITGMTCQNCVRHVREAIESVDGAASVEVNLAENSASFEGADTQAVITSIEAEGYKAEPK